MTQWQEKLRAATPAALRKYLGNNAQRELLGLVNTTLLVFEGDLLHLQSGTRLALSAEAVNTRGVTNADAIAAAASELLSDPRQANVLLLLPPVEFVATTRHLPGVTRDTLTAALALQQDALLPALDMPLAMSINPESANLGEDHIALWIAQERMQQLFAAFAAQDIFLAAVQPRPMGAALTADETRLQDTDSVNQTSVVVTRHVLQQWLHAPNRDLENPAFAEQWQQEVKSRPAARRITLDNVDSFREHITTDANAAYHFFPQAALHTMQQVAQGRRLKAAGIVAAALVVLAILPFAWQSFEFRRAAAQLADNREMSAEARADQAVVASFENEWGPVIDYPQQNVREALFALQEVLAPEQLTSLELAEGLISIEGTSADPQAILQRLEQDPLFTEVVFARATNNSRYFIDLRLNPVNFEGYQMRYFPEQ